MPIPLQIGLLILLVMPIAANSQLIYKCEDAGVVEFSDVECGEDAQQLRVEDLQANISIVEFVRRNYQPGAWLAPDQSGEYQDALIAYPGQYVRVPDNTTVYIDSGGQSAATARYTPPGFGYYPVPFPNRHPGKPGPEPADPEPEPPFRKDLKPRNPEQPNPQPNSTTRLQKVVNPQRAIRDLNRSNNG